MDTQECTMAATAVTTRHGPENRRFVYDEPQDGDLLEFRLV